MATRTSGRTQAARRRRTPAERRYENFRSIILEWSDKPAVKYVAGGIGLAILARLAYGVSERYPEIARFVRENLETVEERLRDLRGTSAESRGLEARH